MTEAGSYSPPPDVAVAIPCYNEAVTIEKVVNDFRAALPEASIHVFDNNSGDNSAVLAERAGAVVHKVRKQGKGYVLQAIFDAISADALVLVDGDDTYSAEDVHDLLPPILQGDADMVVGDRLPATSGESMRRHRRLGNILIVASVNMMFGTSYQDILSGYRVFSRNFVETVPLLTPGFEIETEMTLQALEEGLVVVEIPVSYRRRPAESFSKLNAWRDGYKIMMTAAMLLRDRNPLRLFGLIGLISLLLAVILLPWLFNQLIGEEINSTLLLSSVLLLILFSVMALGLGLLLNAINTRYRQLKQIILRNRSKYD
jgi:glycosyltransferase involved in cell wall biosynthesis